MTKPSLTDQSLGGYLFTLMKIFSLLLFSSAAVFLSSCGLVQTATQVPAGLLQSMGRTVGMNLEQTEEVELKNQPR